MTIAYEMNNVKFRIGASTKVRIFNHVMLRIFLQATVLIVRDVSRLSVTTLTFEPKFVT